MYVEKAVYKTRLPTRGLVPLLASPVDSLLARTDHAFVVLMCSTAAVFSFGTGHYQQQPGDGEIFRFQWNLAFPQSPHSESTSLAVVNYRYRLKMGTVKTNQKKSWHVDDVVKTAPNQ